jgi:hypothetical protein
MSHIVALPLARRVLTLVGLPILLSMGSAASALSQTAAPEAGAARPEPKRGVHRRGPVAPAILRDSIGVTGSKLEQYTRRYESHMAATKPTRDSLRAAMQSLRSSPKSDHSATGDRRQAIRSQFESLGQKDRQFETSLKDLLTQDQLKRYTEWKQSQRDLARTRWHRDHHDRGSHESHSR